MSGGHQIIIDGYNLLRKIPELKVFEARGSQAGREHMLTRLEAYRAASGNRITVVFDGAPATNSHWGVAVIYAPKADPEVVARAGPDRIVVSDDHEVADGARARGAATLRCEEFWAKVARPAPGPWKGGRPPAPRKSNPPPSPFKDEDDDDDSAPRGQRRQSRQQNQRDRAAKARAKYVDDILRDNRK